MPVPIIELQRRLTIVGAIRAGGEKPARGAGKRLECWRLTSPRRDLVEQAARLYGGETSGWESPSGNEWQCYTESPELPIYVMPSYSLRQRYELWEGATKHLRSCEGNGHIEEKSGEPCLCQIEEQRGLPPACDLYTRLIVALPELDTVLGWKLVSTGTTAAEELPTTMDLVRAATAGQAFVPARLRLDQRRGVKDGQTTRFVVPVVDLGVGYLALARGGADSGVAALAAPTALVAEPVERADPALTAAAEPPSAGRPAAVEPAPNPEPARNSEPIPSSPAEPEETSDDAKTANYKPTARQKKLLDLLVTKLREPGHVSTEQVWEAVATRLRGEDTELMIRILDGRDQDGKLHWAPLRESLTRSEASWLVERLERKLQQVEAEAARPSPAPPPPPSPAPPPPVPTDPEVEQIPFGEAEPDLEPAAAAPAAVPFNEFPDGY